MPKALFFLFLFTGHFALAQDTIRQLKAIEINATPSAIRQQDDKLVMTVAGNRQFRTAVNGHDVLKKIPGMEVGGDGTLLLYGRITPAVFIDGKPAVMSPEALQTWLAGLTPDMIGSIALINNPSAQYDAEHKAILDIRLKNDKTFVLTSSLQQNNYTRSDNQLLLINKSYSLQLGYVNGSTIYKYQALQRLASGDTLITHTRVPTHHNNINYQLGINHKHFEMILRGNFINREVHSYNVLSLPSTTNNNSHPTQRQFAVNLNYTKDQLQVLGAIASISNRQQEDIQTRDKSVLLDHWKTALQQRMLIRTLQADYSYKDFRLGGKLAYTTTRNALHYDTLLTQGVFLPDSSRSSNFRYNEYIGAGYLSYHLKAGKLDITGGLRAEYTHSVALITRNYLTWLPSIAATYPINEHQQISLSLARRITRPTFAQLNPFRFYNSPLNYVVGNPNLQPSKTFNFSATYTLHAFTFTLNAGREKDQMVRYPEYNPVTNELEYLGKNLPYSDFAGITASIPLTLTKWWRTQHNISTDYKKEQMPYHGVTYDIGVTDFTIRGNQVFSLPGKVTFDIYYSYRSYSGNSLYVFKPFWNVDLGLQRSWLKSKLNTKLNFYDIFNSATFSLVFREKQLIDNRLSHWQGQQRVVLTLSYTFGKLTYKNKQFKSDEENRAGM